MCTVLDAIVAAALSFLTGSSAPAAVGLAVSCGGRRMGSADLAPRCFLFGTFAFGLQSSASSSPRCFQTRSLRRPPVSPPSHRRPPEQLSSEGLHRPSRPSFPAPSSPSRFPASQVCLRSLYARALLAGSGKGHRGPGGTGGRPIVPLPRFMSLAVQASLQLSGWSLR